MSSGGRVYAAGESPRRRVSKVRSFYARAAAENVHCRFTDTDQHAHTSPSEPRGERSRRSRRRRRRHERSAHRPCACRQVVRRLCRAGSRAGGTCGGARGQRRTTRGRCRVAAAAAGVGAPRPFEAAAAASARPAGGARARKSKRMAWDASTQRAGSEECAGGSVGREESRRRARQRGGAGGAEGLAAYLADQHGLWHHSTHLRELRPKSSSRSSGLWTRRAHGVPPV